MIPDQGFAMDVKARLSGRQIVREPSRSVKAHRDYASHKFSEDPKSASKYHVLSHLLINNGESM